MRRKKDDAEDKMHRMVPLGVGDLTQSKFTHLLELRERCRSVSNVLAQAGFVPEPLLGTPSKSDLQDKLIGLEKTQAGLNKAYVQKMRERVVDNLHAVYRQYFRKLYGRLAFCDTVLEWSAKARAKAARQGKTLRRWRDVPEAIQGGIFQFELDQLKALASDGGAGPIFQAVIVRGESHGLTPNQVAVVREIHRLVHERYRCPQYGADDEWVCQIHLDYRVIKGNKAALAGEVKGINDARLLLDRENGFYRSFLEISQAVPRAGTIRIPLRLQTRLLKRLDEDKASEFSTIAIEIGTRKVAVKGVLARPEADDRTLAELLNGCTHFLARDFGYKNTITLSLIRRDAEVTDQQLETVQGFDKEAAKIYLENHVHAGDTIVERWRFSGQKFLARVNEQACRIDRLKSEIDCIYNRLDRLKELLNRHLGNPLDSHIPEGLNLADRYFAKIYKKFFGLLDHVRHLKDLRRGVYRSIAGLKKAWFGFLSNFELDIAKTRNAAVIREDLTVVAPEKETPGYMGRTFAKMITNGSKGQYIRRADGKFAWNGVPTFAVPSYYTSTTAYRYAFVDGRQRSGDVFRCAVSGAKEHADEHGADTIGLYLLLRPKPSTCDNACDRERDLAA